MLTTADELAALIDLAPDERAGLAAAERLFGGDDPPTSAEIEAGLDYIARTPRIRDVLISGGDPLLLATAKLDHIVGRLRAIPHVEIIRIGTRIPVVCPMRVDDELAAML